MGRGWGAGELSIILHERHLHISPYLNSLPTILMVFKLVVRALYPHRISLCKPQDITAEREVKGPEAPPPRTLQFEQHCSRMYTTEITLSSTILSLK